MSYPHAYMRLIHLGEHGVRLVCICTHCHGTLPLLHVQHKTILTLGQIFLMLLGRPERRRHARLDAGGQRCAGRSAIVHGDNLGKIFQGGIKKLREGPTTGAHEALKSSTTSQLQREAAPLAQVPGRLWKPAPLRQVLR